MTTKLHRVNLSMPEELDNKIRIIKTTNKKYMVKPWTKVYMDMLERGVNDYFDNVHDKSAGRPIEDK